MVWGILSIFCIQNAVKLKKYARKIERKIANAKLQIFAPRACAHVFEYIPMRDRQRFGTTSGYAMKNGLARERASQKNLKKINKKKAAHFITRAAKGLARVIIILCCVHV